MYHLIVIQGEAKVKVSFRDFDKAKEVFEAAMERFGEDHCFFVSSKPYGPPKGHRRKGNLLWCPYCGELRTFRHDPRNNIHKCPICGISEKDTYVRRYNQLIEIIGRDAVIEHKLKGRR